MIDTPARLAFLKKIHLFFDLEESDLAAIADQLGESPCQKGSVIVEQGKEAESFYMIYRGEVKITRKQKGKEESLTMLVAGDYFGELALVEHRRRRSATATALTDSVLLVLSRENFGAGAGCLTPSISMKLSRATLWGNSTAS